MKLEILRKQVMQARNRLMELDQTGATRTEVEEQIELLERLQSTLREMRSKDQEFQQTVSVSVYAPPRKPRSSTKKRTA